MILYQLIGIIRSTKLNCEVPAINHMEDLYSDRCGAKSHTPSNSWRKILFYDSEYHIENQAPNLSQWINVNENNRVNDWSVNLSVAILDNLYSVQNKGMEYFICIFKIYFDEGVHLIRLGKRPLVDAKNGGLFRTRGLWKTHLVQKGRILSVFPSAPAVFD